MVTLVIPPGDVSTSRGRWHSVVPNHCHQPKPMTSCHRYRSYIGPISNIHLTHFHVFIIFQKTNRSFILHIFSSFPCLENISISQQITYQSVWLIVVDIPSKSNATETNPNFVALATWPHNTCINPSWWAAAVAASSVALCWVDADHLSSTSCPSTGLCGALCGAVGICVDLCGAPMYRFSTGTMSVMAGQCMHWERTMSIRGSSGGRDLKAHLPSQQSTIASHPRSTIASQCRHSPLIICSYWS